MQKFHIDKTKSINNQNNHITIDFGTECVANALHLNTTKSTFKASKFCFKKINRVNFFIKTDTKHFYPIFSKKIFTTLLIPVKD